MSTAPLGPRHAALLALPWLLGAALEVHLARGSFVPPTPGEVVLALGGVAGLALAQLALARNLPAARWVGWAPLAFYLHAELRTEQHPGPLLAVQAACLLLIGGLLAHLAGRRPVTARALALGLVLAPLAVLGARRAVLGNAYVVSPEAQLGRELVRRDPLASATDRPPLVLLTVDTLRWDAAADMQSFRRLAARGRAWPRAMATSSWTVPSVASMLTGLPPAAHGAADRGEGEGFSAIHPEVPTLAEELAAAGYATAAVVVNPFLAPTLGYARGFQHWRSADEDVPHPLLVGGLPAAPPARDGAHVVRQGLDLLERLPQRGWFLWLHLYDPHLPYTHAEPDDPAAAVQNPHQLRDGDLPDSPDLRAAVSAAYAAEVAYVDARLAALLDALDARGFWEEGGTLVFASDHGEELWEHGGFEHGHSHHGEVVDVPLAVVGPAGPGPAPGVASLVDIAPTLRAAAGLPSRGRDLGQGLPADRVATASGNLYGPEQHSAREGDLRVILGDDGLRRYDLAADPGEQRPLPAAGDAVEQAAREIAAGAGAAAPRDAAKVNEEALRALGYVE